MQSRECTGGMPRHTRLLLWPFCLLSLGTDHCQAGRYAVAWRHKKGRRFERPLDFPGKESLFRFFVILRGRLIQDDKNFLERGLFIGLFHRG